MLPRCAHFALTYYKIFILQTRSGGIVNSGNGRSLRAKLLLSLTATGGALRLREDFQLLVRRLNVYRFPSEEKKKKKKTRTRNVRVVFGCAQCIIIDEESTFSRHIYCYYYCTPSSPPSVRRAKTHSYVSQSIRKKKNGRHDNAISVYVYFGFFFDFHLVQ